MERGAGIDNSDPRDWTDDGRRRDLAERVRPSEPIVALSRRGLLPQAHRRSRPRQHRSGIAVAGEARSFLHWLRARVRERNQNGGDWRNVIDGLRPHTQAIWRAMPSESRKRFLEHARPWWDIHRHRMAPEVEAKIRALREAASCKSCQATSLRSVGKRAAQRPFAARVRRNVRS